MNRMNRKTKDKKQKGWVWLLVFVMAVSMAVPASVSAADIPTIVDEAPVNTAKPSVLRLNIDSYNIATGKPVTLVTGEMKQVIVKGDGEVLFGQTSGWSEAGGVDVYGTTIAAYLAVRSYTYDPQPAEGYKIVGYQVAARSDLLTEVGLDWVDVSRDGLLNYVMKDKYIWTRVLVDKVEEQNQIQVEKDTLEKEEGMPLTKDDILNQTGAVVVDKDGNPVDGAEITIDQADLDAIAAGKAGDSIIITLKAEGCDDKKVTVTVKKAAKPYISKVNTYAYNIATDKQVTLVTGEMKQVLTDRDGKILMGMNAGWTEATGVDVYGSTLATIFAGFSDTFDPQPAEGYKIVGYQVAARSDSHTEVGLDWVDVSRDGLLNYVMKDKYIWARVLVDKVEEQNQIQVEKDTLEKEEGMPLTKDDILNQTGAVVVDKDGNPVDGAEITIDQADLDAIAAGKAGDSIIITLKAEGCDDKKVTVTVKAKESTTPPTGDNNNSVPPTGGSHNSVPPTGGSYQGHTTRPRTGDSSNQLPWIVLMIASALGSLAVYGRKKRENKH